MPDFSKPKLGATGEFPFGSLGPDDEGALQLAIGEREGNVFIDFGKPVAWLAMPADQAMAFADVIMTKARILKARRG